MLAWLVGALSLGLALVTLVLYLVMLDEMNEVFDADLKNIATAVAIYHHAGHDRVDEQGIDRPLPTAAPDDTEVVTQTWTPAGQKVFGSDPRVLLPFTNSEGLSRPTVAGTAWIVYTLVRADGVVQAAQRKASRQEVAQESAAQILPPMFVLMLIVCGLVVFALRRGLAPLDAAARDVALRTESSLEPIPTDLAPREILPLVASVNALMDRLATALTAQRRFLADAAHELRTPATALRLQLQLLERSSDNAARAQAMAELKSGIDRSQRLIEQLLQVSRTGIDGEPMRRGPVELGELVRSVVGTLSVKADSCGIDLGARTSDPLVILGDPDQLTTLLNNLVENALRHTPAGGVIDVEACLLDGKPALRVIDTGPGIPTADRERVFERFQRGAGSRPPSPEGSGLGLAIVRAVADQHQATVTLHTPASGQGLEVRVSFADRIAD